MIDFELEAAIVELPFRNPYDAMIHAIESVTGTASDLRQTAAEVVSIRASDVLEAVDRLETLARSLVLSPEKVAVFQQNLGL